ncbi:MAG TPA: ABC transporter ATP-binding protein [Spirochaetota bacterium]|jgi:putative ABC transport system ATP-binding protein|nr:MAG: Macrolide export ATP-binding/permease protein MacB [Spirochaetes bacterium ADurb.Bin133]HNZ25877.1 ABC transporter ATP-binding protein [Spirochaetota bacterium]HPY87666.1 ABC transporter ATP-binding protein [Spirochaetota bacterium]HQB60644.1 ABC transporter ATP-binding protein [Spirochaetota bacterium]
MSVVIEIKNLKKIYQIEDIKVNALNDVSLKVEKGDFIAIMGASGSGKSTLMNILGCLDKPTEGKYLLDGIDVSDLSKDTYAAIRNKKLGFVFQGFNLLPRTTALDNVEVPLFYGNKKISKSEAAQKSLEALKMVGLENRKNHVPNKLSGGQQQRVAIARALINDPEVILADEPTGNLDSQTSLDIMKLFCDLNDKGITIILVTHEPDIAAFAKRKIVMKDGKIIEDTAESGKY